MATYDVQLNSYLTGAQVPSPEPTLLFAPISLSVPNETTPPTVSNISPAEGTTIPQFGAVGFDITDASGIGFAVVFAIYPDGSSEVVWDGDAFTVDYAPESTCTVITGGNLRFSVKRFAGWAKVPTIRVRAVDTKGNVLL